MPSERSALAAAAIIQLKQIGMLLLPDEPGGDCDPAKVKGARVLIDGMRADMQRVVDCDCTPISDGDNVLQFNRSVGGK